MDVEYFIAGDALLHKGCLICITDCKSFEEAEQILERMLNNPNENDKKMIKGYRNIHVAAIPKNDCWWNDNCD